jgi:hypothetical protein
MPFNRRIRPERIRKKIEDWVDIIINVPEWYIAKPTDKQNVESNLDQVRPDSPGK